MDNTDSGIVMQTSDMAACSEMSVHDVMYPLVDGQGVVATSKTTGDGSLESAHSSSASSLNSSQTGSDDKGDHAPPTHKLSLINILEMSTSSILSPDDEMTISILSCPDTVDLEIEQEDMMSQVLSSSTPASKHSRSNKAGRLEKAIRTVSILLYCLSAPTVVPCVLVEHAEIVR